MAACKTWQRWQNSLFGESLDPSCKPPECKPTGDLNTKLANCLAVCDTAKLSCYSNCRYPMSIPEQRDCKEACDATYLSCAGVCQKGLECTEKEKQDNYKKYCTVATTKDVPYCMEQGAKPQEEPLPTGWSYQTGWRLQGEPFLACDCSGRACETYCTNGKPGNCQNDSDCRYDPCKGAGQPGSGIDNLPPCSWNTEAKCVGGCPW